MKEDSLKQKHLRAIEQENFHQEQLAPVKQVIDSYVNSGGGGVWHLDKTWHYTTAQAQYLDSMSIEQRQSMPLWGLSMGVKDLFCMKDLPTTAGSAVLKDFRPTYSSPVIKRLEDQGAWFLFKTSMDEFAMGSFTNTSFLGRTSLPGKEDYSAGGSSGGSAATLKAGLADFTMGSDTGGSVRQPASFCSLVGYKPSYGAFSRHGMIAYASSLDQAGIFTKTLEDLSYLMHSDISKTEHSSDMTCEGLPGARLSPRQPSQLSIGYFPFLFEAPGVSDEVLHAYERQIKLHESMGCKLVKVNVDYMHHAAQIYYIIACAEACSNLARYQGVFWGQKLVDSGFEGQDYWDIVAQYRSRFLGTEAQRRIILGAYILSSEHYEAMYGKATKLRQALKAEFEQVFKQVDYLLLPVSPGVAPQWSEIAQMTSAQIYMADFLTVPFSLAGLPALSLPNEQSPSMMGIGIQVVGKKSSDIEMIEQWHYLQTLKEGAV